MVVILTPEQLQAKFASIQLETKPALVASMGDATLNVEGQAKENCTPGKSPYEDYNFPSKVAKFPDSYSGAPYTDDRDPDRELPHMRDVMYTRVSVDGENVIGEVGNPKRYALMVHEGTTKMQARPFITDAIKEKKRETLAILSQGVEDVLRRHST
jgi:hypothetical protein